MKTVYVIRHAKSVQNESDFTDAQRPLTKKGIERTNKLLTHLKRNKLFESQKIIASPAIRTMETAWMFAREFSYPDNNIIVDPRLYLSGEQTFYDILFEQSDQIESVAFFGHNPGLTDFLNHFLEEKIPYLPTSGTACIDFETGLWTEIALSKFKVRYMVFPKNI